MNQSFKLALAQMLVVPGAVAEKGEQAFVFAMSDVLPKWSHLLLCGGIVLAQYLCGLATVTSASRMAFAFARDGGVPFSRAVRRVSPAFRTPAVAIWVVGAAAVLFTVYAEAYATIAASAAVLLYVSYVLPTAIGVIAHGRWWTEMGPWHLGRWFRPLAVVSVLGCGVLVAIGLLPGMPMIPFFTLAGLLGAGAWYVPRWKVEAEERARAEEEAAKVEAASAALPHDAMASGWRSATERHGAHSAPILCMRSGAGLRPRL